MMRDIKFPLATTLLILVVGGAMGWMHQQRLATLRADHHLLVEQAEKLGISSAPANASDDPRITKRQRQDGESDAHAMAAELVAFAKEMELKEKSGGTAEDASDSRAMDLMNRLMELDASQLKLVIAGLRDDKSLTQENRRNLIGFSIMMLGDDHPAAALALYSESADLLGDSMMGKQVVASSLMAWAKDSPLAALAWIRVNESAHPDIADESAKRNIIAGAAQTDPKLAFKLIGEMKLEDSSAAIDALVESGKTPEQRTAILAALRDHLATLPDSEQGDEILKDSLESMGRNLSNENFDTVKEWIAKSKLTPEESARFAAGLSYFNTKQDTGRWIDWMAQNLPESDVRECADNLIGQWTQQDYLAAGRWLTGAPEGPAKNASVATYAETVAEYEPQVAVQWALTLPEGSERKSTLESIYQNWPKKDAKAAAEFALKYGIDTEPAKEEP
ncbi:MAG: hypothetical protein ABIS50_23255 [Luteolibacter sp.]|uniref:hypothetical protein n=1 Tax=Luteolibacter sp. TaxID=1962973 RepID=UPI003264574E